MNSGLLIILLQSPFQLTKRDKLGALELLDPPLADLMDRHRVEIMQLFTAVPERGDEVRVFENGKVLRHGLPRHGEAIAELVQGLAVSGMKPIQQRPPRSIGQRLEDFIHGRDNRQPNGCMSSETEIHELPTPVKARRAFFLLPQRLCPKPVLHKKTDGCTFLSLGERAVQDVARAAGAVLGCLLVLGVNAEGNFNGCPLRIARLTRVEGVAENATYEGTKFGGP